MMKEFKLVIVLLLAFSKVSFGQISGEELDEKYTPPAGSIFDDEFNEEADGSNSVMLDTKHDISFQAMHLLRGKINVEYRRNFSDMFSMAIGGGHNFAKDYLLPIFFEAENIISIDDDYSLYYVLNNGTYKSGFNINPNIRLTQQDWYYENVFFQIDYRYDYNGYEMNSDVDDSKLKTYFSSHALNLIYGIKGVFEINKKYSFVNQVYAGFGGRFYRTPRIQRVSVDSLAPYGSYDVYQFITDKSNRSVAISASILIGYSLGLGIN